MILILIQFTLLFLTSWGWGFWIWKVNKAASVPGWKRYDWFFYGLAGYAACILFLHALVYCNLPLKFTSWCALLIAFAGVLVSFRRRSKQSDTLQRRRRREAASATLLFVAVSACQGTVLFHAGPENYYGAAHADQVNYVLLSEFLIEKPFSTSINDINLEPWLAKGIILKNYRLGQSVANGYLGVVSLSNAKYAYGTLTIFLVGVGALSVFVLARLLSIPRSVATLVGAWWGLLPAITKMHLDGFLSQTCILFIFPAIAAVYYVRRGKFERTTLLLWPLYLAYLLCTYTEVYVLGVGLMASLLVVAARRGSSVGRRLIIIFSVTASSLVLTGLYARLFLKYIAAQYKLAASHTSLDSLVPMSGTWVGWKQIFFGYDFLKDARLEQVSVFLGLLIVFAIIFSLQGRNSAKRRFLLGLIAPPIGVLAILLSEPSLAKYAFSKLLDTFTTFWLILACVGLMHLCSSATSRRVLNHFLAKMAVGLLVLLAFWGSWPLWSAVYHDRGTLGIVDSPAARKCYMTAENNRSNVYLISEPNGTLCAWFTYAARHSKAYVNAEQISDLLVPVGEYAFRRLPQISSALVVLDDKGPKQIAAYQGSPTIAVNNPQGVDVGEGHSWYWIGTEASLGFVDYTASQDSVRRFSLEFNAEAGPASPDPARSLVLSGSGGFEQRFDFTRQAIAHFDVVAHPGNNLYVLKVAYPPATATAGTGDPRILMLRAEHFVLTSPRAPDARTPNPVVEPTH